MSLLSVTVKRAKFMGPNAEQLNTYVTLQLQSVKSTTITVKGSSPAWEQDFLFETNHLDSGLFIEIWNKGLIWDKVIGCIWLPLNRVPYSNQESAGEWLSVDAEQVIENGIVVATRNPTGHYILIDCRIETTNEVEDPDTMELQKKLEAFNYVLDQEMAMLRDNNRRQQFFNHSGLSEDSDYTSDVSYPLNHQANSSASQYLTVASEYYTPQRSLENSRDNSYERDTEDPARWESGEHGQFPNHSAQQGDQYYQDQQYQNEWNYDGEDPLSYNSRPPCTKYSQRYRQNSRNEASSSNGAYCDAEDDLVRQDSYGRSRKGRKPSLERQSTLYDEYDSSLSFYNDGENYQSSNKTKARVDYQQSMEQTEQQQQDQFNQDYTYQDQNDASVYPSFENYDGYYYNYDYNYGYDQSSWAECQDKDMYNCEGYGYSDDTGYYYNGQWYTWDSTYCEENYTENDIYNDYGYQEEANGHVYATEENKTEEKIVERESELKSDLPVTKRRLLHHGDLSSSGGSVDSEQLLLRRESSASVVTPTGDLRLTGSPTGELDRLQSDLESKHYSETGGLDSRMSGRISLEEERRRSSVQSHGSGLSRRERAEDFRRRRSSSICSEQVSPYNSYEDNERTPVNEGKFSEAVIEAPQPPCEPPPRAIERQHSEGKLPRNVSLERNITQEPIIESPAEETHVVPTIVERPNLTARQRWLMAFNKVCAQLNVSRHHISMFYSYVMLYLSSS